MSAILRRILSFDKQALAAAKTTLNQVALPDRAQLHATEDTFFMTFWWPGTVERMAKLRQRGIGSPGEFEPNIGPGPVGTAPVTDQPADVIDRIVSTIFLRAEIDLLAIVRVSERW